MSEAVMTVDARGHKCPVPSLRLRKALAGREAGVRLTLLATDAMARIDVPFLMQELGGRVVQIDETDGILSITVETGDVRTG
ncbi:sulfurtransferase TusA family protein [Brevundimonas sp.]|uniref:sulfurtransferase TusA family protein n=1 Tax=Brevundimonas sp. TaxID=1871086 RepID=UPI0028A919CA|nr:sulfurtransferase TusA family protein [Brevundimonas sp.]